MTQIMAYFRVKRLRFGATYEQFIEDAVPLEQLKAFLHQTESRYAVTWCEYVPS
jgi:hypothetical protein